MPFKSDSFRTFLQNYHVRKFDKGELILVQGETPQAALIIKKGVVKTYNITIHGEEKPLSFDIQEQVIPLAWVFGKVKGAPYYYEAFTRCEVYCVPRDDFTEYIRSDTSRLMALLEMSIMQGFNAQLRMNALEQSKAVDKVLHTIHYLCLSFGIDVKQNMVRIQIPLTQQDVANFIGLTRETTGIELKKLQRTGVLSYRHQNYIVRTDRLNALLDEEYDLEQVDRHQVSVRI